MPTSPFELPPELLLEIIDYISITDLRALMATSRPIKHFLDKHYKFQPLKINAAFVLNSALTDIMPRFPHIPDIPSRAALKHLSTQRMEKVIVRHVHQARPFRIRLWSTSELKYVDDATKLKYIFVKIVAEGLFARRVIIYQGEEIWGDDFEIDWKKAAVVYGTACWTILMFSTAVSGLYQAFGL